MKPLLCCELGPNYQLSDSLVALASCVYSPNKQKELDRFMQFHVGTDGWLRWTDAGRTALTTLLASLSLGNDAEVIIQAYTCVVVPNAVLQAKCKPVFADINPHTYNCDLDTIKKVYSKKTKAVVVQHNFGIPAEMSKIKKWCKEKNIVLIEDCAHSLGSYIEHKNNIDSVGLCGDAAFFSFGRDKTASCTSAGCAYISPEHPEWRIEFEQVYNELGIETFSTSYKNLLYAVIMPLFIRPFYHIKIGKVVLEIAKRVRLFNKVYTDAEKKGSNIFTGKRYNFQTSSLLLNQLYKLDAFIIHRKKITAIYNEIFNSDMGGTHISLLRYPLPLHSYTSLWKKAKEHIIQSTQQLGFVVTANWYDYPIFPQDAQHHAFDYDDAQTPEARELCGKVLNLPTNIHISEEQAGMLAKKIKDILSQYEGK